MIETVLEGPANLDTSPILTRDLPDASESSLRPRLIGRIQGSPGEPTLLCLGSTHGNEPSGTLALERIFTALEQDPTGLQGELVGLVGNRRALAAGQRFLENDLNRYWQPERVERLRTSDGNGLEAEDAELFELDREINKVLAQATGEVFAMDLHTTSGLGPCFVVLDDSLKNREQALHVPSTVVVGLEEELSGTVTHHLADLGVTVFGFEAGQHDDPTSVDRAEAAIWITLESSGVLAVGCRPEPELGRQMLAQDRGSLPPVVEVRYRHAVRPQDGFEMAPGFINFQPVHIGLLLATDRHGDVRATRKGLILMPLYQKQGADGFFVVRPLQALWLGLSAKIRRGHWERFIHLLPGVKRNPDRPNSFVVDRKWARFLAPELFHLLGYRRSGSANDRFLVMTRRTEE